VTGAPVRLPVNLVELVQNSVPIRGELGVEDAWHLAQIDQRHRAGRLAPAGAAGDNDERRDGNKEAPTGCHVH
jgi:hypothetical protein